MPDNYWQQEALKLSHKLTKAIFVIGYLVGELKDKGMYAQKADEVLVAAEKEAARIYGEE